MRIVAEPAVAAVRTRIQMETAHRAVAREAADLRPGRFKCRPIDFNGKQRQARGSH
jgi:hypothetical protein